MTDRQYDLLLQAKMDSRTADKLLQEHNLRAAASRAYYTMFYVATALLLEKEMNFSKHKAVIAAFGKHLAKTGEVPIEYHRFIRRAHEIRGQADYDLATPVSVERVRESVERAAAFVELGERILGPVTEHEEE